MANTKVKAEQLEAAQTNITSLGTLTTLTVDDITIDGSTISDGGDLTLDIGGDINIDADGGDINFKDGGTLFGQISNSSGLYLVSNVSDADIFIRGNDGGSYVNALTFDMSDAGTATFNHDIIMNTGGTIRNTSGQELQIGAMVGDGSNTIIKSAGDTIFQYYNGSAWVENVRFDDGNVGIGTNSPSTSLDIVRAGVQPLRLQSTSGTEVAINMVNTGGNVQLEAHSGNFTIDAAKVSIASTSTASQLNVYEASNSQMQFQTSGSGTGASDGVRFGYNGSGAQIWNFENNYVRFATNNTERVRITPAGFVGINDTAPPRRLSIIGEDGAFGAQTSGNSRSHILLENNGGNYIEFLNPAGSGAGIFFSNQNAQNRGGIIFDSDALYLQQGGYDRAIIRPDGAFQTSDTNALVDFDSGGNRVRNGSLWGYTLRHEGTGANPHGLLVLYNAASPDSTSSYPIYFTDSSAARFHVNSAGNLWTSDYGYITSDETLKENIVDATPKLADIMKLKVRNFNWKKSYHPNSNGKMLGFIAQEFEEVFPALINEHDIAPKTSAKDDADHVPNMKKSVVAGALIPALVKAMQEQQTLIETLQTKVAALEAK